MKLESQASDAGKRLDRFLQEQLPAYSRTRLQDWIRNGRVRVGGKAEKPSYVLRGGETLEVEPAELAPLRAEPEAIPLEILYEDADVVAVNKPAGMVVHAGAGCHSGTLVNALLHRFESLSGVGGELRPGIVHRLDRYTSGVMLVARHDAAHRHLAAQFAGREVEKVYLALVHGAVKQEQGRIEKPIARDPVRRIRMTARLGRGRAALTEYRVLRRFRGSRFSKCGSAPAARTRSACTWPASVIRWRATGCTERPPESRARRRSDRFFLHAHRIRFRKPVERGSWSPWKPRSRRSLRVDARTPIIECRDAMKSLLAFALFAGLARRADGAGAGAAAPSRPRTTRRPASSSDVTRVNLLFTVTDKKGRFVTDLGKDDFEVREGKKPQKILRVHGRKRPAAASGDPDRYQQQHPRPLPVQAGSRHRVHQQRDAAAAGQGHRSSASTRPPSSGRT